MNGSKGLSEVGRLFTGKCLIATDIDRTILAQTDDERQEFFLHIAPSLLVAASYGTTLAFMTGNSMHQLCSRFLKYLLKDICHKEKFDVLDQFHFFSNSGGVYSKFSAKDKGVRQVIDDDSLDASSKAKKLFDLLTFRNEENFFRIQQRFIDTNFLEKCRISERDIDKVREITAKCIEKYNNKLETQSEKLSKKYDMSHVEDENGLKPAVLQRRLLIYGTDESPKEGSVQLTIKPILSFLHAVDAKTKGRLIKKDERTRLLSEIQGKLDSSGLSHIMARPGGRSSIDMTLQKLDKAYALEYLIDSLNMQGHSRQGKKFGSNAIYFGDEVIAGFGNDYPVTRIPGLLVFAVNPDKDLIPFLSHVFVPSSILAGPEATSDMLRTFNSITFRLINEYEHSKGKKKRKVVNAIDALKKELFVARILEKMETMKGEGTTTVEDWQTLHSFVTLMSRDDPAAREWLFILLNELDAIMAQISLNPKLAQPGIGSSHPDA